MSARFKPYPHYKDSGVEWLGEIPDHWQISRVGDNARLINGYPFDSAQFDLNDGLPLVRIRDLENQTTEVRYAGALITEAKITTGDIIVGMDGDFAVARWRGGDALLNQRLCSLHPKLTVDSAFLFYLLGTPLQLTNDLTHSTTVKHLSSSQVTKTRFGCPPKPEQRAIAEFLNRETAKIDNLIAKKERLLELLEEKRAALITHAVTRGLNPDAPLRDSGIEWLAQIPKHWEVIPLKNEFRFEKGRNAQLLTASFIHDNPGECPVYSGQTESEGVMGFTSTYEYDVDEVLFATTVGARAMTPMTLKGKFSLSQNCLIMRPKTRKTSTRFFFYELHPLFAYERGSIPAHMQPSLRISDLRKYAVACPPSDEQQEIASHLDERVAEFGSLSSTIRTAIDRLHEYRAALITAAVTGKIDVRHN